MPKKKQAAILTPAQFRHAVRVAGAVGRYPLRDQLILWLTHTCGLRATELARLEIRDILHPSGNLRREVLLRAETTKSCRNRTVYLTHARTVQALEAYLAHRLEKRLGCELGATEYRGLNPLSRVILTNRGHGFSLSEKRRELLSGPESYRAADPFQQLITRLYRQAGIKTTSHAGRRTFATRLLAQGVDEDAVSTLLGHADIDSTRDYLQADLVKIARAFEMAL